MAGKRRRFTREFKARVAVEALREREPVRAIAARYQLHPNQVSKWKRQAFDSVVEGFGRGGRDDERADLKATIKELHAKIGGLTVDRDFFRRACERWGVGDGRR